MHTLIHLNEDAMKDDHHKLILMHTKRPVTERQKKNKIKDATTTKRKNYCNKTNDAI